MKPVKDLLVKDLLAAAKIYCYGETKMLSPFKEAFEARAALNFIKGGHRSFFLKANGLVEKGGSPKEEKPVTIADYMDIMSRYVARDRYVAREEFILKCLKQKQVYVMETMGTVVRKPMVLVKWEKPPLNYVKVNFDGSCGEKGMDGGAFGYIVRDCQGQRLFGGCGKCPVKSGFEAELTAVTTAVQECVQKGIKNIVIEGDSIQIIEEIKGEKVVQAEYSGVYGYLNELLTYFEDVKFSFTYREGNKVADCLAHMGADPNFLLSARSADLEKLAHLEKVDREGAYKLRF